MSPCLYTQYSANDLVLLHDCVFGCRSIVHIHKSCIQSQSDLQPKSIPQQLASELLPLCLYKCFQSRVVAKLEELVEAENSQFIN